MSFGLFRRGSVSRSEPDRKLLHKQDLEVLQKKFIVGCNGEHLQEPRAALKEFRKRITESGGSGTGAKSKLNFSGCRLNNVHLKVLVESLAVTPLVAKLDLSNNLEISNDGIEILLKLLKGQTRLIKKVDIDSRLSSAFLGEVVLGNNSSSIAEDYLFEVTARTQCLRHANTLSNIRRVYLDLGSPEFITLKKFTQLWDTGK